MKKTLQLFNGWVSSVLQLHPQAGIFRNTAQTFYPWHISCPAPCIPLPLVWFDFLRWHFCCAFPWRCYQRTISALLLEAASSFFYRLHVITSRHVVTNSLCPWAPTISEGHKPWTVCLHALSMDRYDYGKVAPRQIQGIFKVSSDSYCRLLYIKLPPLIGGRERVGQDWLYCIENCYLTTTFLQLVKW